ncbi:hypothetical protein AUEXF2481DRAFT_461985 [Aureobasidium subglaciale EXF-2481]|uniref:Uncharacterized protein n=1 Tax=Aureobasidium subglaciale (strain EXF-2481) TaxID=1043005 RepID=A0A074Y6G1_AURSE|nr:uncharacterized protein AUEXF2481DRAFT_461985 [Aureobasidium subglaciale EXF-2481]KEQ91544.1 hypothetical protein AUEXF2481DRAFT_461985 [Aureobasidium subglaciale EXF-2481]
MSLQMIVEFSALSLQSATRLAQHWAFEMLADSRKTQCKIPYPSRSSHLPLSSKSWQPQPFIIFVGQIFGVSPLCIFSSKIITTFNYSHVRIRTIINKQILVNRHDSKFIASQR